jgi:hypothetical protein
MTPKCPGQDMRFWTFDDIFEVQCPYCKKLIEFWKDEPMLFCPACKREVRNPRVNFGCVEWCKYAEECVGTLPGENSGKKEKKSKI